MTEKSNLPKPLTGADIDLRGYEFMPLYGDRLKKSETWVMASAEGKVAALALWWHAYGHEVPAGSLPDNDTLLGEYAGYGVARKAWLKIKPQAMRGWIKCADGRLYHQFVATLVTEAWQFKKAQRDRTEKARLTRLSQNQSQNGKAPVTQSVTTSVTASTGQDRTGQDIKSISGSADFKHRTAESEKPPSAAPLVAENSKPEPESPPAEGDEIPAMLRSLGVEITGAHPLIEEWAEADVTAAMLREAVDIARMPNRKPTGPIPPNYLAPIVDEMLEQRKRGASGQPTGSSSEWWLIRDGINAKARELGIEFTQRDGWTPAESWASFRARVFVQAGEGPWVDLAERDSTLKRLMDDVRSGVLA